MYSYIIYLCVCLYLFSMHFSVLCMYNIILCLVLLGNWLRSLQNTFEFELNKNQDLDEDIFNFV